MASPGARGQHQPRLSGADVVAREKCAAARAAAELVQDGMRLGLGTGTTVAHLLPALAERRLSGVSCVATSPATERAARELGLTIAELDELGELDMAIDGADQVDPAGWLVKGGGGALTREKIVAAAATRFVVIVSADKAVAALEPPVPLELIRFGVRTTLAALAPASLRTAGPSGEPPAGGPPWRESPDGGLIGDYLGPVEDPRELSSRLAGTPGVVDHGLFAPELVSLILVAGGDGVESRPGAKREG
jgi:ribose 5-phosphate isomerase A